MPRPIKTVILHGWSDCSESFVGLKDYLIAEGVGDVQSILYADYESREDNVTFDDIADGLQDEFIRQGLVDPEGRALVDLNVIVHSTGGLVIRHWIARHYLEPEPRLDECPVKRLVMLAPANFGSPLAHRGKSFLGQLFKGRWKVGDMLEVGRQLLEGLELGSPYQWRLAHRDLLVPTAPYSADRIQLTILVGSNDYRGLRGWVNKPGTDGTVVIAGTSLDSLKLTLDCTKPTGQSGEDYSPYSWSRHKAVDEFVYGILPGLDHGTIVSDTATVGPHILRALRTRSATDFSRLIMETDAATGNFYQSSRKDVFQQFLVRAIDDSGNPIPDFTLEFFVCKAERAKDGLIQRDGRLKQMELDLSDEANRRITAEFHPHSVDPSYRRFLINLNSLGTLLDRAASADYGLGVPVALSMRVYVPRVDGGIEYATERLQNIVLYRTDKHDAEPTFLLANTTTLLELRIDRVCSYVRLHTVPRKH